MADTYLDVNLAALAQVGPAVAAAVPATASDGEVEAAAGAVTGVLLSAGTRRVRMHSARDPLTEAAALLPDDLDAARLVVLVGVGAGFLLDVLEARGVTGRILVLEPSGVSLKATLSRRSWGPLVERGQLRVLAGPDYRGWLDLSSWIGDAADAPTVIVQPVLARERPDEVRQALDLLKRLLFNARSNEAARRAFAGPYLLNTLAHLRSLETSRDVAALFGRFSGVPAVVLAAGPSLNRNLEQLRPHREGVLVLAVDTALRTCLAAGVAPDLVVSIDPGEANRRHLDVTSIPARTHLVAEPSLAPGSLDAFAGRVFTLRVDCHHPWPWLHDQGMDRAQLLAWGSVLTTTLDLAVRCGCRPIALAGADFAYTDGQPYCRGTVYEEDWAYCVQHGERLEDVWRRMMRQPLVTERGIDGREVQTSSLLLAFRDWVDQYCARHPQGAFVNITGRGLLRGLDGDIRALGTSSREMPALVAEAAKDGTPRAGSLIERAVASLTSASEEPWVTWAALAQVPVKTLIERMASGDQAAHERLLGAYMTWRARAWSSPAPGDVVVTDRPLPPPRTAIHEVEIPVELRDFRSERWQRINRRRLEHLASLHLPLAGRTVLELGAGIGDLTDFFLDRGCRVTAVDGRAAMLDVMRARFEGHPCLEIVQMDLDPPALRLGEFDVVVCYGLLYLIGDAGPLLDWAAASCNDLFLLETLLFDGALDGPVAWSRPADCPMGPLGPSGSIPPRQWIMERLGRHFPHVHVPRTQPCHHEYPLVWDGQPRPGTRSVFIGARRPLPGHLFASLLPARQDLEVTP